MTIERLQEMRERVVDDIKFLEVDLINTQHEHDLLVLIDAEIERQAATDEDVQAAIDNLQDVYDANKGKCDRGIDYAIPTDDALETAIAALRQYRRAEPCVYCDDKRFSSWNLTRSGKFIPEKQIPQNYCSNCGRRLRDGD